MAKLIASLCLVLVLAATAVSAGAPQPFHQIKGYAPKDRSSYIGVFAGTEADKKDGVSSSTFLAQGRHQAFFYNDFPKFSTDLAADQTLDGETFYDADIKCTGRNVGYFLLAPSDPAGIPKPSNLFYCQSFFNDLLNKKIISAYTSSPDPKKLLCPPISSSEDLKDYPEYVEGLDIWVGVNTPIFPICPE